MFLIDRADDRDGLVRQAAEDQHQRIDAGTKRRFDHRNQIARLLSLEVA